MELFKEPFSEVGAVSIVVPFPKYSDIYVRQQLGSVDPKVIFILMSQKTFKEIKFAK